jgi:DNA polymerase III epsilon subunit-like protein
MEENTEAEVTLKKESTGVNPEKTNQNILFGTITYEDDNAYEEFVSKMNINQALFVLIASANYSQAKGGFNLLESETLSAAIRAIRKNGEKSETAQK